MGCIKSLGLKLRVCVFGLCAIYNQSNAGFCVALTQSIETTEIQRHPLFDEITTELANLKTSFPQQTMFFVTQSTTPQLYNFLVPPIQQLCQTAKITSLPHLLVRVGNTWETFNAQSNNCCIFLGENFLKLFLWNHQYTQCIFSIIAHELGHLFYKLNQEQDKSQSETLADEFALQITQQHESLATALTLTTLSVLLFVELNQFLPYHKNQYPFTTDEITYIINQTTYHLLYTINRHTQRFVSKSYSNDQLFSELFNKALHTITPATTPLTPEWFTQNLTHSLTTLYTDKAFLKKLVCLNTNSDQTAPIYPPLCKRIEHIQSLKTQKSPSF